MSFESSICAPPELQRTEAAAPPGIPWGTQRSNGRSDDLRLIAGCHEVVAGERYDWHGRRRGGDPRQPTVSLQYTLAGEGRFHDLRRDVVFPCIPGTVFAALIPSDHRYWLPEDSPGWRFLWIDLALPAARERITAATDAVAPVVPVAADGPFSAALLTLMGQAAGDRPLDDLALDRALLELAWTFTAAARSADPRASERRRFLAAVEDALAADPAPGVEDLARRCGLSRAAFTRSFAAAVGEPPAHHLLHRRLGLAGQLLLESDASLDAIAHTTGFADATSLGKAFRRYFRTTPGRWRRLR